MKTFADCGPVRALLLAASLALTFRSSSPPCSAAEARSEWVSTGPDGKLVYKTTPAGDRIMDFSSAGYMGGGVALPDVPVKVTLKPSGGEDDTAAIQAAIDQVSAMPPEGKFRGAVLLEPGIYPCAGPLVIRADGVVLRGGGADEKTVTIKMVGERHGAIAIGARRGRGGNENPNPNAENNETAQPAETQFTDAYVPSGAISFNVADASGFAVGDTIRIRRPVTKAWVEFMQMDKMSRGGRPQTWMRPGTSTDTERTIAAISGHKITLDIPLTDSFDAKYVSPPGASIAKIKPAALVSQSGVENLHIQAPPMEMSYQQAPYTALRINGQDCWAKNLLIEETMNSVSLGGKRLTLERVVITRTVPNLGASKPAEFAPNASQVLLDRCSSSGDNIWHVATGGGQAGPIVLLNCTFGGRGHIEGHQRWTTGMLLDNCRLADGGIDLKNRGSMGSGHGWGMGWSVAWNCVAKTFVVQQPPGAANWMIGCIGPNIPTAQPFNTEPPVPPGISDAAGTPVAPKSLYLAQLAERLGPQALKNIGYSPDQSEIIAAQPSTKPIDETAATKADEALGKDYAAQKLANVSNVRNNDRAFAGERALDTDPKTYWSTSDGKTEASLEVDLEDPQAINAVEICEVPGMTGRVQAYKVEGMVDSDWKLLSEGTTIGERKLDHFPQATAWKVRLTISQSKESPAISKFGLFLDQSKN